MIKLANYIGGELIEPASGVYLDDVDPATGRVFASVPDSDAADIDRAVAAAEQAFPAWSGATAAERGRWMNAVADGIEARLDELARDECVDNGKPLTLARRIDIPRAVANLRFFAGAVQHITSDAHFTDSIAINYTQRQPRGVAGCISPWNLPLYLLTWKIAPALATGNTVVAKPSEVTPLTAFRLAEICREVGLPPGVLNIVHGRGQTAGAALVGHPRVPAVSFTGGTTTGAAIAREAAPVFKKLSLELGGKNPNIVFADADFDDAVATGVRAAFTNQGQICLCGSRVYIEESIFDRYLEAFVERARALRVGDPLEAGTDLGALVSETHRDKVLACIQLARDEGGTVRCGGGPPDQLPERIRDGFFCAPTVITGLGRTCRTNREEIFGPVVTLQSFRDEAEAIAEANATDYGLAATVWTRDLARGHRVAGAIDAGTVWVNCWLLRDLRVPFGGMKQSGVGREGGDEALRFFTEPKNVCVRIDG